MPSFFIPFCCILFAASIRSMLMKIIPFHMKKTLLLLVMTIFTSQIFAQEGFKMGIQAGLPFNDFNEALSVVVGADVSYMYPLGEVIDVGPAVGFIHGFAETFQSNIVRADLKPVQFAPLSAGVRIWTSNDFSFGGNVGWALGVSEGNDGGLYYRPTIAYLMSSSVEINFSYTGIELDEATWSTLTLGIVYNFEPKYRTRR
jgi:hypothetical protein